MFCKDDGRFLCWLRKTQEFFFLKKRKGNTSKPKAMRLWQKSLLQVYLGKLFFMRFFFLLLFSLSIICLFDYASSPSPWALFFSTKLPFLYHKITPFILFFTSMLWMRTLVSSRQWFAVSSMGLSLRHILKIPLLMGLFVQIGDSFFIMPSSTMLYASQKKHKRTEGKVALDAKGWQVCVHPNGSYNVTKLSYRLDGSNKQHFTKEHQHILTFSAHSDLLSHVLGRSVALENRSLVVDQAWTIQGEKRPVYCNQIAIPAPSSFCIDINAHPMMLSLREVIHTFLTTHQHSPALLLRCHYLCAHWLWGLFLIPLGSALMVPGGRSRHLSFIGPFMTTLSIVGLYIIKEWIYSLSIPLSYMASPWIIWISPAIIFLIVLSTLLEKRLL